jgi:hypothetical protein
MTEQPTPKPDAIKELVAAITELSGVSEEHRAASLRSILEFCEATQPRGKS